MTKASSPSELAAEALSKASANPPAETTTAVKAPESTAVVVRAPGRYSHAAMTMPAAGRSADLAKRLAANKEPIPVPPKSVDATMARILRARRGHNSPGEEVFYKWLTSEIVGRLKNKNITVYSARAGKADAEIGALVVRLPTKDGKKSPTLFSCHIDTVDMHRKDAPLVQDICYDPNLGHIFLNREKDAVVGTCLGSDDGAGIWLMLNMISNSVPGTYMFHRGEERGCIGSNIVLKHHEAFLKEHDVAIAFDRPDDNEIITHQGNSRCASDKCAKALQTALQANGMKYELSDRGLFTDTKVYRGVIAECFNLGVGYYNQHTSNEHLNYGHLTRLLKALLVINFDALPVDRDPKVSDFPINRYSSYQGGTVYNGGGRGGAHNAHAYGNEVFDADEEEDAYFDNLYRQRQAARSAAIDKATAAKTSQKAAPPKLVSLDDVAAELDGMTVDEIAAFAAERPEAAATLIAELYVELLASRNRIETYRQLIGMNDV